MIDAKEGKIDIDFFKNIIQNDLVTTTKRNGSRMKTVEVEAISGCILNFFAYINTCSRYGEYSYKFEHDKLFVEDFKKLANQTLTVPFKIVDELNNNKENLMKYEVGFIGCDKNEKYEIYPVQGWIVSFRTKEEEEKKSIM